MKKNSKEARAEYRAARRALNALAEIERKAGIGHETDAYLAANDRVIRAERHVSPWLRF